VFVAVSCEFLNLFTIVGASYTMMYCVYCDVTYVNRGNVSMLICQQQNLRQV